MKQLQLFQSNSTLLSERTQRPKALALTLLVLSALVASCATPTTVRPQSSTVPSGAPGSSPSTAGQGSTATNPTPNASQAARSQTFSELQNRGWQFVATTGPSTDPSLIFLRTNSYQKTDELTRITTLDVFSGENMRRFNSNRSASYEWEVNCGTRTARVASVHYFKDGLGTSPASAKTIWDTKPSTIPPSSVGAAVYGKVCASGPSSGTGIAIAPDKILTASHVINKCTSVDAVFNGKRYPAKVLAQDQKNDLGLIEVEGLPINRRIEIRRNALNGEAVMAAGYPLAGLLSADLTVTTGIVNSLAGIANDPSKLQVSAQVSSGNSGGALFDKSGNLLGVVVSKLDVLRVAAVTGDMAQNVNFAVKPEVVKLFLDANGVRVNSADASVKLEGEDLAARAKEVTVKMECKSRPPTVLSALN